MSGESASQQPHLMSEVGEKGYLRHLFEDGEAGPWLPKARDDAAILDLGDRTLAFTIDRGPQSAAALSGLVNGAIQGRLAATACLSDLLAVWSVPFAAVLSVICPMDTPVSTVDRVIAAFGETCDEHGVSFVGGDTKRGPWNLTAAAIGFLDGPRGTRHTADIGDFVYVAGHVGEFTTATLALRGEPHGWEQEQLSAAMRRAEARWGEMSWLRGRVTPTASTDASDGLYEAILNLIPPNAGALISIEDLPFSPQAREWADAAGMPRENLILGGGDWNIVFTTAEEVVDPPESVGLVIRKIGRVVNSAGLAIEKNGLARPYFGLVSDHFKHRVEDLDYFEMVRHHDGYSRS